MPAKKYGPNTRCLTSQLPVTLFDQLDRLCKEEFPNLPKNAAVRTLLGMGLAGDREEIRKNMGRY